MKLLTTTTLALSLALPATAVFAAPNLSNAPSREIILFYPGVTPIDWMTKAGDHSGARGMRKGETCIACHEIVKDGQITGLDIKTERTTTNPKIEPTPGRGKAGTIPVKVTAANDGTNLYIQLSWKEPAGEGGDKMDPDNPVKVAFMLEGNKVERATQSGCWETCHSGVQTMPNGADGKTKYVEGGAIGSKAYELYQWKSGKGEKVAAYVADTRTTEGGGALVDAVGEKKGDTWTVTFTRKLAGGGNDMALESGKTYNFGLAIHHDHTLGRFHYVSLGYHLGIDTQIDLKEGINANK